MGETKNQIQPKTEKEKKFFDGIKNVMNRAKPQDGKDTAKTYVERLVEMDKIVGDLVVAKSRDVEKEKGREDYNRATLVELQIQQSLFQLILESVARCSDIAEKH